MKTRGIFKLILTLTVLAVLSVAVCIAASAEEEVLYEVTLSDGSVTAITEASSFSDLVALSPRSIKLYSDINIDPVNGDKSNYVSGDLDIDLNGYTMRPNGAYLRPSNSDATLTVHGGKIEHTSSYFAFIGGGNISLYDCEISAQTNFFHVRNGSVAITDCTVKNSTTSGVFIQLSYAGATSDVLIDSCDFSEFKATLINPARNSSSVRKTVTVKDTVLDTPRAILTYTDQEGAQGSFDIIFTGTTAISSRLVLDTPGIETTTYTFTAGVKASYIPTVSIGKITYGEGATGFEENTGVDAEKYPYIVTRADVFYKLTAVDGTEINVAEKKSFSELLSDYGDIKAIKLYALIGLIANIAEQNFNYNHIIFILILCQ